MLCYLFIFIFLMFVCFQLIMVPGYTQEEKIAISKRHLLPKQLKEHGLTTQDIEVPDNSIKPIISNYTREAGVRSLERKIGGVCRAVAVQVAETTRNASEKAKENSEESAKENEAAPSKTDSTPAVASADKKAFLVTEEFLTDVLGPPVFESEVAQRLSTPGVAVVLPDIRGWRGPSGAHGCSYPFPSRCCR